MARGAPTMADVAKRAGVSRALVSIVMRGAPGAGEATRQRVLRAADEIGYVPDESARRLSRGRRGGSGALGVVFAVGHAFHGDVLEALYDRRERHDLVLSGTTQSRDESEALQTLRRERCEAALLLGGTAPSEVLAEIAARLPLVVVLRRVEAAGVDCVLTDEAAGMAQAVDHLISLGHRRIGHVHGGEAPGAAERRRGFDEAMAGRGLAMTASVAGGLTEEDGARAADELIARGDLPDALTVFNDRCALGLIDALRRCGVRAPEDVSVVGFDDIRAAGYAHVGLTTIRQDAARIAELALLRATERIADPAVPARLDVVPPRLVIRATTSVAG